MGILTGIRGLDSRERTHIKGEKIKIKKKRLPFLSRKQSFTRGLSINGQFVPNSCKVKGGQTSQGGSIEYNSKRVPERQVK